MKQLVAALAMVLTMVFAAPATSAAADVSGKWSVEGDVVGNPVKFTCELKQEGEKLTGTASINGQNQPMNGTVKESVVSFTFDVVHDGTTYNQVYTGKLKDTTIEGKIEVAGVEGTFMAKKQ